MHPDYKEKMEEKHERDIRLNKEVNQNMLRVAEDNDQMCRNTVRLMKRDTMKL
jgi:hypothetical protein